MGNSKWGTAGTIILSVIAAVLIIVLGYYLAGYIGKNFGMVKTETEIQSIKGTGWETAIQVVLGMPKVTAEGLIVHIAILFIIVFGLGELINLFSMLSPAASWMIALGLGLIAGATEAIHTIAVIAGLTAGLGALGMFVIIGSAIFAAIVIHVGAGRQLRQWVASRQIDMKSLEMAKGAASVADTIKSLRKVGTEFEANKTMR